MKKSISILIISIILALILFPICIALIYELKFDPAFFVNEWYKFILNYIVMTSSFFLIYIFWAKHQLSNLTNAAKQIIINRLEISANVLEECINELNNSNTTSVIKIVSDKIKKITPLSKEIPKFLTNPIISNNKDLFLLLNTFYEANQKFLEELINNEFINFSEEFGRNLSNLHSRIVELKIKIEELHE